ncbi:MAG: hypothetical protein LBH06_03665 [Rikenellaceae bacterium]|jgi:hypothetical protein|nr:hypothetical protein [Rikenellaceae bacterium]
MGLFGFGRRSEPEEERPAIDTNGDREDGRRATEYPINRIIREIGKDSSEDGFNDAVATEDTVYMERRIMK